MTQENGTEQENQLTEQTTAIAVIDEAPIKIPDTMMFAALEGFAMGKTRAQIADEILQNLPDELASLQAMEPQQAKALLCSRLRQADPNSSKFAKKYQKHYRDTLKAIRDTFKAKMRTTLTQRVQAIIQNEETLEQTAQKLRDALHTSTTETITTKEMQSTIKTLISVCKTQNQNTSVLTAFIDAFEKAYKQYEHEYDKYGLYR